MEGRRKARQYTEEFKKEMVELYNNGKSASDISREYDLTRSVLNKWIKCINETGSTKAKDNISEEQKELKKLRKENDQLKMENDILKQAALIFGRK